MNDVKPKKTILLAAGGTGGHMFPAEALAQDLLSRGFDVVLATDERGKKYEPFAGGIQVKVLSSATLKPGLMSKIKSALSLGAGYFQAQKLVKSLKPSVVVGFGGYPSLMPVYAAQGKRIPTIIHESNAVLGRANEFLSRKADRIAVGLPDITGLDESDAVRTVVTGNPVRPDIAALYNQPYPAIEQDGALKIFVMGGSQGASVFAKVLPEAFASLPEAYRKRLEITQQCREEDLAEARRIYHDGGIQADLQPFFKDVAHRLAETHLFIGRSGAATVAEMTTAGRPAIFVPYPHHDDQQQKRNADSVADLGGAWVMTENGFTKEALLSRIENFLQNPQTLFTAAENARKAGKPDAARKLGNLVTALASGWDKDAQKTYDLTQGRQD
ncbi:MAG: undecaprenyldiphospho-muramoylpentapeptide beta-N-acetylglucosaminyltransferase [Pseudomonadota bacterium]